MTPGLTLRVRTTLEVPGAARTATCGTGRMTTLGVLFKKTGGEKLNGERGTNALTSKNDKRRSQTGRAQGVVERVSRASVFVG